MESLVKDVENLSLSTNVNGKAPDHKKNRIQVSNTKKPLFFNLDLGKWYIKQHNDVELSALGMGDERRLDDEGGEDGEGGGVGDHGDGGGDEEGDCREGGADDVEGGADDVNESDIDEDMKDEGKDDGKDDREDDQEDDEHDQEDEDEDGLTEEMQQEISEASFRSRDRAFEAHDSNTAAFNFVREVKLLEHSSNCIANDAMRRAQRLRRWANAAAEARRDDGRN